MSIIINKDIVEGLGLSGYPMAIARDSKFHVMGILHGMRLVSMALPFSPAADMEGDPVFDTIHIALEKYFNKDIILKIYYNNGEELWHADDIKY